MTDLGELLDPVWAVIDLAGRAAYARYRYDGLDLILEGVADRSPRRRVEIFAVAGEKMNAVDACSTSSTASFPISTASWRRSTARPDPAYREGSRRRSRSAGGSRSPTRKAKPTTFVASESTWQR